MEVRKVLMVILLVTILVGTSIGQEDKILSLIEKCRSDDWREMVAGYRGLASIGDTAIPYISKVIKDNSEKKQTRTNMAYALGNMRTRKAVEALIENLSDESIQFGCVTALGMAGDKSAIPRLKKILNTAAKKIVVGAAAESLAKLGEKEVFGLLLHNFLNSDKALVRKSTGAYLEKVLKSLCVNRSVPELIKFLEDDHDRYSGDREAKLRRYQKQYGELIIPRLLGIVKGDPNTEPSGTGTVTKKRYK